MDPLLTTTYSSMEDRIQKLVLPYKCLDSLRHRKDVQNVQGFVKEMQDGGMGGPSPLCQLSEGRGNWAHRASVSGQGRHIRREFGASFPVNRGSAYRA